MDDLKSIQGVEIFAAGKWNGDEYSEADLDEMVHAFTENKATLKPALKLGHAKDQKLLQKDGYPAAGWIANVYRKGSKLYADFIDMPAKIHELVRRKAYRKVSSEIYWNIEINKKKYKRLLSAVSLLGEDMPAVSTLDDMLALYGVKKADRVGGYAVPEGTHTIKEYQLDTSEGEMEKTENEIKLEAEAKKYEQEAADAKKALADKDELIKKYQKDAEDRAAEAAKAILEKDVAELETDGLVTPAMKPYITALLGTEAKEYSVADKKLSRTEMVREVLKLHAAAKQVNFSEKGNAGESAKGDKAKADQLDAKITKYMEDNKCTYSAAYKAVHKQENLK